MMAPDLNDIARHIRLLVLDVDGVLTDGKLYYGGEGEQLKTFNTQDGHGIKMLRRAGVEVGIITGRKSRAVEYRAKELGIHLVIQGREDKFVALGELLVRYPCELEHIAFMGDDWPDLGAMTRVGLGLTVANAHPNVQKLAQWTSRAKGGEGAVREACDWLLQARGAFDSALATYLTDEK